MSKRKPIHRKTRVRLTKKSGSGHKQKNSKSAVRTVTTKPGDTYYKFAQKYNVSVAQLRKWNKYADRSIPVGVKIRVK
nr:LysM domain-containing protein [Secundilactobacillus collinoides]